MRLKTDLLRQLQLQLQQRVAAQCRVPQTYAEGKAVGGGRRAGSGKDVAACLPGKSNDNRNRFRLSCGHVALPPQVDPFTALRVVC